MDQTRRAWYGDAKCRCGKTIALKKDGTFRQHLLPRTGWYRPDDCEGSGEFPVEEGKALRDLFPGEVGSRWRDRDGDVWVLCLDGQMRRTHKPTAPDEVEKRFGPMTKVDA